MKRFAATLLTLALLAGALPAAFAVDDAAWKEAAAAGEAVGLHVDWYPEYQTITRLFGIDRMALKQNDLFGLFTLEGESVTGCIYDAIDQPLSDGTMVAMKGGKWGLIDKDGNVLKDFIYATKEEVKTPVNVQIVQKGGLFAIADKNGKLLSGYDYWNAREFVNGYAALQDDQGLWGYIDGNGVVAVPFRYYADKDGMGDMREDGFAVIKTVAYDGWNVVASDGEELFQTGKTKIWDAGQGMWGFTEGGKVGFANEKGEVVIPAQYDYYTDPKGFLYGGIFDENGIAKVYTDFVGLGYEKRIDTTGAEVPAGMSFDNPIKEGLSQKLSEGRWGFIGADGKEVVPYLYDGVSDFDCGYASVLAGGVYGMLKNPLSSKVQEEVDDALAQAGLSVAWVETENILGILGRGQLVTEYKILGRGGMMGHKTWGDYGLRNAYGELVVPVLYGATLPGGRVWRGYFAIAETETDSGKLYTDYLGNTFTEAECRYHWSAPELDVFREPGPDGTLESGKCGYGDPRTGEKVLPAIYDEARSFADGVGIVRVGEDRYAIDKTGARLFDLNSYGDYSDTIFVGGRLLVQDKITGKYGFVDQTGNLVIPTQWDKALEFHEGLAQVCQGGLWGYIDLEGNVVVPCVLKSASQFEDGLAIVKNENEVQGILRHPGLKDKVSSWAEEEVGQAGEAGYITPRCQTYRTFTITRLQFAELAVNYYEKTAGTVIEAAPADTFTDTADEAVLKACAAGIVQGRGDGRFDPGGLLTRQELAAMLCRAMTQAGVELGEAAELESYADGAQVAVWARDAMAALVGGGILQGTGGNSLSPRAECTVEQAILLVWRCTK